MLAVSDLTTPNLARILEDLRAAGAALRTKALVAFKIDMCGGMWCPGR